MYLENTEPALDLGERPPHATYRRDDSHLVWRDKKE